MTRTGARTCQTIRQKSASVLLSGPCVAMNNGFCALSHSHSLSCALRLTLTACDCVAIDGTTCDCEGWRIGIELWRVVVFFDRWNENSLLEDGVAEGGLLFTHGHTAVLLSFAMGEESALINMRGVCSELALVIGLGFKSGLGIWLQHVRFSFGFRFRFRFRFTIGCGFEVGFEVGFVFVEQR